MADNNLVLLAKALPTIFQLMLAVAGSSRLLMRHVLKKNPSLCPQVAPVLAVNLAQCVDNIATVNLFSVELCMFQSTVGLGLTLLTTIVLSTDEWHRLALIFFAVIVGIGYLARTASSEKGPYVKRRELVWAIGCGIFGVLCIVFLS